MAAIKAFVSRTSLFQRLLLLLTLLCLVSCEHNMVIINDVDEREANEIIVFLASKGIAAEKVPSATASPTAGMEGGVKWSIAVESNHSTEAMAYLNQNGLPRKKGTSLLDLFGKATLMSSEKEETIRYQAGLAEQIANMIRKIDGVIDADVQLSFPATEGTIGIPGQGQPQKKITAAIYVKHQGILDDPNSHLITKIKRLVAGSVAGLDVNDVTVISDRSRFTDVTLTPSLEPLDSSKTKEYVSIWSIVMSKTSAGRFRVLFFLLAGGALIFALLGFWLLWKFYPIWKRQGGLRGLLNPIPIEDNRGAEKEIPAQAPESKK